MSFNRHDASVHQILTLTGTVEPSRHRDFLEIDIQLVVGIVECNCNRRVAERLSRLGSGENNILHISAAELLGALFAEHPAHRIANIALSTAVRT